MKTIKLSLLVLLTTTLFLGSCKKYEDGPMFSLRTKKARVAGTWEMEKYFEAGVDKTVEYKQLVSSNKMELKRNGDLDVTLGGNYMGFPVTLTGTGTWEFLSGKEEVETNTTFTGQSTSTRTVYKILRLKNKELWVEVKDTNPVQEFHFKSTK
ncbi:MAG: hypothetical protein J0M08_13345 [Bacteroidetes bacterium]|nr:hypothetical protein [Bacteroidota bacterium]